MTNGLAIWHYPHRTVTENVRFFAECGFESVSLLGHHMHALCKDGAMAEELAELVSKYRLVLTVHHTLPRTHAAEAIEDFRAFVSDVAEWQRTYGSLSVLSFDVPEGVRDDAAGYIDLTLSTVPDCKVAVEDFGLTERERRQIEHLKGNRRFGYLLDMGHLFLRLRGENRDGLTLFTNSPEEHPLTAAPKRADFLAALGTKEFPIFEIHLHNNDGKDDLHLFLEDGAMEMAEVAHALRDFGFDGVLTLESAPGYRFPCPALESDLRIQGTFAYWKSLGSHRKKKS